MRIIVYISTYQCTHTPLIFQMKTAGIVYTPSEKFHFQLSLITVRAKYTISLKFSFNKLYDELSLHI